MVMTRGQTLIRPMIVIVSLVMSGKLLYTTTTAQKSSSGQRRTYSR